MNPSRPSNQEPSQQPVRRQAPQWPAQQPHGLRSKPSVDMETAPSDMSAFTGAPSMPSADLDKAGAQRQWIPGKFPHAVAVYLPASSHP